MSFCLNELNTTETNYINILDVLAFDVARVVAAKCVYDKALLNEFITLYEPIRHIVQALHSFHQSHLQEPIRRHLAGQREGYAWSIFDEHFNTLADLYALYKVTFDEVKEKLQSFCKTHHAIDTAIDQLQGLVQNNKPILQLICPCQRLPR